MSDISRNVYEHYSKESVCALHYELDTINNTLHYQSNSETGDQQQWADWEDMLPNMAPLNVSLSSGTPMGAGYTPIRLFHVSMIWAIWKQWCTFMYEENYDPNSDWITSVLKHFKKELIRRLHESMSVIQWLKVADNFKPHSIRPLDGQVKIGRAHV